MESDNKLLADSDSLMTQELTVLDSTKITAEPDQSGLVMKSPEFRITKTKEKYNHDQEYYMWFFRRNLILPDIRYHLNKKSSGAQPSEDISPANQKATSNQPSENKKRTKLITPAIKNKAKADSIPGSKRN